MDKTYSRTVDLRMGQETWREERNPITKEDSDYGRAMWPFRERDSFQLTRILSWPQESQFSSFSNLKGLLEDIHLFTNSALIHTQVSPNMVAGEAYGQLVKY